MGKRSVFSKIFSINMVTLLVCITILGSTQMILLTNYLTKQNEQYLEKNIETIVEMISSNRVDNIDNVLDGFARISGSHIFIIDSRSRILASASANEYVNNIPMFMESQYSKAVLSGKKSTMIGTMSNLFNETMFTLQMPVIGKGGDVIGAVSVSRPIPEHEKVRYDLFKILLMSMVIILITSLVLSYVLAKRFSVPLKNISKATKEFAKGNFSVRVDEQARNSDIYEVAELAEAFNNMAAEIEKSEEVKNMFISDVSHELRTPMTTIGGFVSGMLDDTIPQEKQREYLEIVYKEITRLSRLVNTFLDITRLRSDKMILSKVKFDINELIRICIIGFEHKIDDKNIDVELELESDSCMAYADKDSITRVMTNLLDNAVKFTDVGGKITISVKTKQQEVIVSVKNTGAGIVKEQRNMIFERFYKADKSRSENTEGTGIGLYLVKSILVAHDKDITVDGKEGEYAEFKFRLDRAK